MSPSSTVNEGVSDKIGAGDIYKPIQDHISHTESIYFNDQNVLRTLQSQKVTRKPAVQLQQYIELDVMLSPHPSTYQISPSNIHLEVRGAHPP